MLVSHFSKLKCAPKAVHRFLANPAPLSTLVSSFEKMVGDLPYREAIRYTKDNKKLTAGDVKKHVDSLANGMLEFDFKAGDSVGLMLGDEIIHRHIILLAAAKLGMKVVDIDSSITDVDAMRKTLSLIKVNALFFSPVTESLDNLLLLRKSIPEFYYYDDSRGQPFHSKYFPELRYFIHTGFDIEMGAVHYHNFLLPSPVDSKVIEYTTKAVKDEMPLYCKVTKDGSGGVAVGTVYNHKTALDSDTFMFAKKLLSKEYLEI